MNHIYPLWITWILQYTWITWILWITFNWILWTIWILWGCFSFFQARDKGVAMQLALFTLPSVKIFAKNSLKSWNALFSPVPPAPLIQPAGQRKSCNNTPYSPFNPPFYSDLVNRHKTILAWSNYALLYGLSAGGITNKITYKRRKVFKAFFSCHLWWPSLLRDGIFL